MTDPIVRIEPTRVKVEPGGQAPVTVTVRNTSDIVEGYRLTVLGSASAWADVVTAKDPGRDESDVVRVYPGQEATATVVFAAPAGSAGTAGEVPFGVLAESVVDPSSSAAAEGDLEIGRVDGLTASITPVTSTGRWSGRHTVKISNWGNSAAKLRLVASDPDDALGYLVHPDTLDLPVGSSAVAAVRVRSRRPFLRGAPVRLPFRVVAEPDRPGKVPIANPAVSDPGRPVLDGALNQKPVLTRGTVALGALGVLAAAAAVIIGVTATPAPETVPTVSESVSAPQDVQVTAASATSAEVRWSTFARQPTSLKVFWIDAATKGQQLPATLREQEAKGSETRAIVDGLPPEEEACFQVVAVRGESQSVRSEAACATTPPAPVTESSTPTTPPSETPPTTTEASPSTTPPTTSEPTTPPGSTDPTVAGGTTPPTPAATSFDNQWVLALPFSPDVPGQAQIMAARRELLENAGLTVGELEVSDYPDASLRFRDGWKVLYVGPFASKAEAEAECAASGLDLTLCGTPYQPGDPT